MKKILYLFSLCTLSLFAENFFETAESYYNQDDFEKALETYHQVVGHSAALDYNKANTLMRLGNTYEALAYYRRALWQKSGDADIRANLQQAAKLSEVEIPPLPILRQLTGFLSTRQWQATLIVICWLFAGWGLLCRWIKPLQKAKAWVYPLFVSAIALTSVGTWSTLPSRFEKEAVVGSKTVTARFEPLSDATEHFTLPGGTLVKAIDQNRNWVRIQVGDKNGWVLESDVLKLIELP